VADPAGEMPSGGGSSWGTFDAGAWRHGQISALARWSGTLASLCGGAPPSPAIDAAVAGSMKSEA